MEKHSSLRYSMHDDGFQIFLFRKVHVSEIEILYPKTSFSMPIAHLPAGNKVFDYDSEQQEVTVTGPAEVETVCGLISRLSTVVCRAIRPSHFVAEVMSFSNRTDKVLWWGSSSFWVNKQHASSTNTPEIGFS